MIEPTKWCGTLASGSRCKAVCDAFLPTLEYLQGGPPVIEAKSVCAPFRRKKLRWYREPRFVLNDESGHFFGEVASSMETIIIMGSGNLARSLVTGWLNAEPSKQLHVLARSERFLSRGWDASARELVGYSPDILQEADLIVLAVKPKDVGEAFGTLARHGSSDTPVLSVMAGITLHTMRNHLPHRPLIRTMPNICSRVNRSVTGACFSEIDELRKSAVLHLLNQLGYVLETEEHLLNPMTAVYGSGPAYVYLFIQTIVDTAQELGIPDGLAREMVLEMMRGAAELALAEPHTPFPTFVREVASPGGTTEAMLNVLDHEDWPGVIKRALFEAGKRATQLGSCKS